MGSILQIRFPSGVLFNANLNVSIPFYYSKFIGLIINYQEESSKRKLFKRDMHVLVFLLILKSLAYEKNISH